MTILLDCGWDIHFDTALLEPLREVVKRVDLVLISHPDLEHLGVSGWIEMVVLLELHRERRFLGTDWTGPVSTLRAKNTSCLLAAAVAAAVGCFCWSVVGSRPVQYVYDI